MYSTGIAYILWFFSGCGVLGFHRFYLGKIGTGLLWMFTGGLLGIGAFFDLFTLPRQVREENFKIAVINGARMPNNNNQWRNVNDAQTRIIPEKESIEHQVLKLAKENKGIITASELALLSKTSIDEAKKALDTMVSKGHVELRVRQSGSIVYVVPDMMDNNEPFVN
jgi:hypothetical protein